MIDDLKPGEISFEPAFPFAFKDESESEFDGEQFASMGMLLRDYFAGQALLGIVASDAATIARQAYEIADAMMVERDKSMT